MQNLVRKCRPSADWVRQEFSYHRGKGALRWSTPDPADDWMMVGHLFVRETGVVFVDPPLVPGLVEAAKRLGNLRPSC